MTLLIGRTREQYRVKLLNALTLPTDKKNSGVYFIGCYYNDKPSVYIGLTNSPDTRMAQHRSRALKCLSFMHEMNDDKLHAGHQMVCHAVALAVRDDTTLRCGWMEKRSYDDGRARERFWMNTMLRRGLQLLNERS